VTVSPENEITVIVTVGVAIEQFPNLDKNMLVVNFISDHLYKRDGVKEGSQLYRQSDKKKVVKGKPLSFYLDDGNNVAVSCKLEPLQWPCQWLQ
jgi:hypothetical protein